MNLDTRLNSLTDCHGLEIKAKHYLSKVKSELFTANPISEQPCKVNTWPELIAGSFHGKVSQELLYLSFYIYKNIMCALLS